MCATFSIQSLLQKPDTKSRTRRRVSLVMLAGHRQIDDRQHHEYEGLQRDNKQVKDRPGQRQDQLQNQKEPAAEMPQRRDDRERKNREQQEHHLARVQVAVETQRQGDRAREKGDRFEDEVDRHQQRLHERVLHAERLQGELAQEAKRALHLEAVEDDQGEYRQRHRERR